MLCPYCLHDNSKVIDKRNTEEIIRRRRECLKCEKRFNTREAVERAELRVIKKDGRREEFNREKIKKGILRACEKRPIGDEVIEKMIGKIEEKIRRQGADIKTSFIGEVVARELKKTDKIAYIRFASVYKDFADLEDFKNEIKGLINK
ncbi:MAG: transcriptional regulator NrdR [Nanoarchaeota archaeon]|nr:transcriptional regulator NrdR [Nanoarchaeota archaeon]